MRRLLRKPLTWMVLAEAGVVTALIVTAWSALGSTVRPAGTRPLASGGAAASGGSTASPSPDAPPVAPPPRQWQLPGLNVDPIFWRTRLDVLNRDQVVFEQLEWRLVHGAMDTVQQYVDGVVLPSVRRAESLPG